MRAEMSLIKSIMFGVAALIPGLIMGGSVLAQDGTPAATPSGPTSGYPIAIHEGSCDDLTAQPNYEVENAVGIAADDDDVNTLGQTPAAPMVLNASGTIDSSLAGLADEGNAVAVHASKDDYGTIIACGNVVGAEQDGKLVVALNPVDDGTVVGVAILNKDTSGVLGLGDDQVQATVYIFDTSDTDEAS